MSFAEMPLAVLLVPGALTAPSCYDKLVPLLEQAGYDIKVAALASNNPEDPDAHTAETDGLFILHEYLLPLLNEGRDVVVFAHSFGATAMTGANMSFTKSARESNGQKGGVVGIVYISGALAPDGQSQIAYLGGALPDFCKMNTPRPGVFVFDPIVDHLFNDADPDQANELAKGHLPHAMKPMNTPVSRPLWTDPTLDQRRVYFMTMLDQTFPPEAQQMFIDNSGVAWEVVEIGGGHEAFMTKPDLVAKPLIAVLKKWAA